MRIGLEVAFWRTVIKNKFLEIISGRSGESTVFYPFSMVLKALGQVSLFVAIAGGLTSCKMDPDTTDDSSRGVFSPQAGFEGPYVAAGPTGFVPEARVLAETYIQHSLEVWDAIVTDAFLISEFGLEENTPCASSSCTERAREFADDLIRTVLDPDLRVASTDDEVIYRHSIELFPGTDPTLVDVILRSKEGGILEVEITMGAMRETVARGQFDTDGGVMRAEAVSSLLDMINMSSSLDDLGDPDSVSVLKGTAQIEVVLTAQRSVEIVAALGSDFRLEVEFEDGMLTFAPQANTLFEAGFDGLARTFVSKMTNPTWDVAIPSQKMSEALDEGCAQDTTCDSGDSDTLIATLNSFAMEAGVAGASQEFNLRFQPDTSDVIRLTQGDRVVVDGVFMNPIDGVARVRSATVTVELNNSISIDGLLNLDGFVRPENISSVLRDGTRFGARWTGQQLRADITRFPSANDSNETVIAKILDGVVELSSTDSLSRSFESSQCILLDSSVNEEHPFAFLQAGQCSQ